MSLGDLIAEPVGGTGKGIVKGARVGRKTGGTIGAIGGALATAPVSLTCAAIGGLALLFSAGTVALAFGGLALAFAGIGALLGSAPAAVGGGFFGAASGGVLGFLGGLFRGASKVGEKSPAQRMKELRTQSALSDGKVAQAEYYLQQKQQQAAEMESLKQQRAEAQQTVANPEAGTNNAANVITANQSIQVGGRG